MLDYLLAFAVIFVINLLPAFGPPTGGVLVFLTLTSGLDPVLMVIGGALAAASGRLVLAVTSSKLRDHFSDERIANLDAVRRSVLEHRARSVLGLILFVISPLPSAQLFIAVGLTGIPPFRFTVAFFCGRLVSYTVYVTAASAAKEQIGDVLLQSLTSPLGVSLQIAMLICLGLLLKLDWTRILHVRK